MDLKLLIGGVGISVLLIIGLFMENSQDKEQIEDVINMNKSIEPINENESILNESTTELATLELSTDKEIYHSNELMNITLVINSSNDIEDVTLRVYGINARYYRLDETRRINMETGTNTVEFTYKTPRCYGCAGIIPGTYQINADLTYNNETIANITKDIGIEQ